LRPTLDHEAESGGEWPAGSAVETDYCDQRWMIYTVAVNTVRGRPGCTAAPTVTRYFLRFDTNWQIIAQTQTGDCGAVKVVAPTFPEAICQNLP
jgi:hypothetical protein